jgi:hypothetical protein
VKQKELLRHLRKFGCYLKRQGKEHELWSNPLTGTLRLFHDTPKFQTTSPEKSAGR